MHLVSPWCTAYIKNNVRCVFQSLNKNHFFYLNKFFKRCTLTKAQQLFYFAFAMANRPNINPQSCLSTKRYFYFLFNWTHKKLMCAHHIIDVFFFTFSMCCTNQFITRFFINFSVPLPAMALWTCSTHRKYFTQN